MPGEKSRRARRVSFSLQEENAAVEGKHRKYKSPFPI
jgi:hypothetical protein